MPPRNSSTRNSPFDDGEVRLRPQRAGEQHPDPGERDRAEQRSARRAATSPPDGDQPSAIPVSTITVDCTTSSSEHVRGLGRRAARRATAASSRAASTPRSAARSRWRCRGSPSPSTSPRVRARRGRGSRPDASVVFDRIDLREEHEDAERDDERDEQALAPPQREHELDARLRDAAAARAPHDRPSLGEPQEDVLERLRAGAELAQQHATVAQPLGELRDERRAWRPTSIDVLARPRLDARHRRRARGARRGAPTSSPASAENRVSSAPARSMSSDGVPHATSRPWSTMPTRSQSCSASSIACVVRSTVTPRVAQLA